MLQNRNGREEKGLLGASDAPLALRGQFHKGIQVDRHLLVIKRGQFHNDKWMGGYMHCFINGSRLVGHVQRKCNQQICTSNLRYQ